MEPEIVVSSAARVICLQSGHMESSLARNADTTFNARAEITTAFPAEAKTRALNRFDTKPRALNVVSAFHASDVST